MSRTKLYSATLVICLFMACEKGEVEYSESFIRIMDTPSSYIARTVLELGDKSFVLCALSATDGFNSESNPSSGMPSLLSKYTSTGALLWNIELPKSVQVLWHCRLLDNGDIVAVGFNSEDNSEWVGLATISPSGELLKEHSFFNSSRSLPSSYGDNSIDCAVLQNGNIALTMPHSMGSNISLVPRLVVLDTELNKIVDRRYSPNSIVLERDLYQIYIQEDASGNLILNGRDKSTVTDTLNYFAFMLKLQAGSYEPIGFQLFHNSEKTSPSNLAISNTDDAIWTSCGPSQLDSSFNYWFNLRNQEKFLIGSTIQVWKVNTTSQIAETAAITGYLKNGFIQCTKKCESGGYIMVGTCNINTDQQVPSEYRILVVKVADDMSVEWIQTPDLSFPTIGADIVETSHGYLVSATHASLGEATRPIVLQIDKNGLIR